MSPVDLWITYKKVKQRIERAKSPDTRSRAENAAAIAKQILENPSLSTVAAFRAAEKRWFSSPDVTLAAKSLADEFESAIRSGNYEINKPPIKTSSLGYDPKYGVVYCAQASAKPGQLKIGSTTMALSERIAKYGHKYGYKLTVVFSIHVSSPARVEQRTQDLLRQHRVQGVAERDSTEWYKVDRATAIAAIQTAARQLCVAVVGGD